MYRSALAVVLLAAATPAHAQAPACCTVTITARVPDGTGPVYLAGSLPALGPWRADGMPMAGTGRERVARLTAAPGTSFEYKFTLGSWERETQGYAGAVPPNHRLTMERDTVVVHELADFKKPVAAYIAEPSRSR